MDELKLMATRPGFVEVFWRRLRGARRTNSKTTWRQVFNEMEDVFQGEYGQPLWPSFDAFRQYMKRMRNVAELCAKAHQNKTTFQEEWQKMKAAKDESEEELPF